MLRCFVRLAIAVTALALVPASARAQGRLDARYAASLAGMSIGTGAWFIDISEGRYTAAASGTTAGLLRVFTGGHGSTAVRGAINNGNLVPATYAATITAGKTTEEMRIELSGGNVREITVDPPLRLHPGRIPITDAHLRGILDPMSASLARVSGNGAPVSAEACDRALAVFDGHLRYGLQLAFKRLDHVRTPKGYEGPVVVCALYFTPIAGHIPDRAAIRYLARQRDIEVWLAPIAGTRFLVPHRITIPTPLGLGALQATQFVSVPQPRLTPTSATPQ